MGLLERMRSGTDSTGMQVLFALVVIAFVGLYANPQGDRSGVVAVVNGVRIVDTDLSRTYRNELQLAERRANRTLSDAEQKGLREQVRQSLIEEEVLLQEAQAIGLEVSDGEVARALLDIPYLKDKDGKFAEESYERFIKRQQFTRSDFEQRMRDDLLRAKLQQLVYMGASLSDGALKEAFVADETRVDLDVIRIHPSSFKDGLVISDEERTAWMTENESRLQESYDSDKERLYVHPESVDLRLVRLPFLEDGSDKGEQERQMRLLKEEIEAGRPFADVAEEWSQDPSSENGGSLGKRPLIQLSETVVGAIDGLGNDAVSDLVMGESDVRLYQLVEKYAASVDSLDDVKLEIADKLMTAERLPALAQTFAEDTLLPTWMSNSELPQEFIDEHELVIRPSGPISLVSSGGLFGPPQAMLDAAETAEVGSVLAEVYIDSTTIFVGRLTARLEPDLQRFDEERSQLRERYLAQTRGEFYQSWVTDLKSRASIE